MSSVTFRELLTLSVTSVMSVTVRTILLASFSYSLSRRNDAPLLLEMRPYIHLSSLSMSLS